MTLTQPLWLLGGLGACLGLFWLWRRHDRRQQAALQRFVSPHLIASLTRSLSRTRRWARRAAFMASVVLVFVALAGPQFGHQWQQITRRGHDVMFAVDTSRSMLTTDLKPDRLTRAKLAIDDLVNRMDGDAVGLIAFAGSAFVQSPLTLDYGAFHESLSALDTHVIPRGGTNIASAIHEAQAALRERPNTDKLLILLTDGENLEGDAVAAAKSAAQQGLRIYTVGVGTPGGDLIPLPADEGAGFLKDAQGGWVKSHLDEIGLQAVAKATGGSYAALGARGEGLEAVYRQAIAPLSAHDLASRQRQIATQRYQWPLAAALALLLASAALGTRRRTSGSSPPMLAGSAALLLLLAVPHAHASTASAEQAYHRGNFTDAERDYAAAAGKTPGKPVLQFNAGAAAYRAGDFRQAAQAFQSSLDHGASADSQRLAEQQSAYYNLGNTLYRIGQKSEQTAPSATMQNWTQAVKAYDTALRLRSNDADSQFNRDLVQRKLDELKKQQQQQQQDQKQSQSQDQSQSKSQGAGGSASPQKDQAGKDSSSSSPGNQPNPKQNAQQSPAKSGESNQPQPTSAGNAQAAKTGAPRADGQPSGSARRGDPSAQGPAEADAPRLPGEMSAEEARELLDSVRGDERRFPATTLARGAGNDNTAQPVKDW